LEVSGGIVKHGGMSASQRHLFHQKAGRGALLFRDFCNPPKAINDSQAKRKNGFPSG
jgi:hypothetical protein